LNLLWFECWLHIHQCKNFAIAIIWQSPMKTSFVGPGQGACWKREWKSISDHPLHWWTRTLSTKKPTAHHLTASPPTATWWRNSYSMGVFVANKKRTMRNCSNTILFVPRLVGGDGDIGGRWAAPRGGRGHNKHTTIIKLRLARPTDRFQQFAGTARVGQGKRKVIIRTLK